MDILLNPVPPGSRFSLVAYVMDTHVGILRCRGVSPEQEITIAGAPPLAEGKYTFYELERTGQDFPKCGTQNGSSFSSHQSPFSAGEHCRLLQWNGWFFHRPTVDRNEHHFVEKLPLACAALRANFACPVIEGDISDPEILKQVHSLLGSDHNQLTGGFPCQGFSRQGDQLGMQDHRSHSLCYILVGAWLLQDDEALLECVANVIHFPMAISHIKDFAEKANMHITQLIFDLQDQWPVRRNRFWCRLARNDLPHISIPRWPTSQRLRALNTIMPLDAMWNDLAEQELAWDPSELAINLDPSFGDDQRLLQADEKSPTVLHSWGHINRPCPCGCRSAFSVERLRSGGARGFGLISSKTGNYRHLHHEEGAMLCTVPPSSAFPMPPRAALSLLGQIAAPLQVLCVQHHILASLQQHFWGWTDISPMRAIELLQEGLVAHSFMQWITRQISIHLDDHSIHHEITINTPVTVGELMRAEKSLAG
eukprot:s2451_g6.t1